LDASGSATTEELFQLPVTLENVVLRGPMFNIQALGNFNDQIIAPILIDQIAHSFMRPWQQGDPVLPVQFRNADLQFDEAVLENILINNLKSNFSVYANGFFELTNTSLEAAGGIAKGYFSMNPNENNFMTLELNAESQRVNPRLVECHQPGIW
jgi:hypothetical protein